MPDDNRNVISGGDGDETLSGTENADTFVIAPSYGNDTITGFTNGQDLIDLSAFSSISNFSDLTITSDDNGVTIDLTAHGGGTILLQEFSLDELDAGDFIFSRLDGGGTSANDVLQADDDGDRIEGGGGDDSITGGAAADLLYGGGGADTLTGGEGNDTIDGGEGDDTIEGDEGADFLRGGAGEDALYGGTGADSLAGHEGDDELYGGEGDDILEGGAGADAIVGGTGDDKMYGDGGDDVFVFATGHGDDTIYDFTAGADKIDLTGIAGITNFNDLSITESDDGVTIDLTKNGGGTIFLDGTALDNLDAGDFIFADSGPPPVEDYDDWQYGTDGRDTFQGTSGDDRYDGLGDKDEIHGNAGDDYLRGGAGNDALHGGTGNDTLVGGGGADRVYGDAGDDKLYGGEGNDLLADTSGENTLYGGSGGDWLYGGSDEDTLYGGEGSDLLNGQAGDDTLYGGADWDKLYGRAGNDTLTGGAGTDQFIFEDDNGNDIITDFTDGEDAIDLTAIKGITGIGDLTITADGDDTVIDLTAHGGGSITLENVDTDDMDASDFLFYTPPVDSEVDGV